MRRIGIALCVALAFWLRPEASHAAITFTPQDCGAAVESNSTDSIEVAAPSPADGELMLAWHYIAEDTFTGRINESGWTNLGSFQTSTGTPDITFTLFGKIASGESGTYTFDATASAFILPALMNGRHAVVSSRK